MKRLLLILLLIASPAFGELLLNTSETLNSLTMAITDATGTGSTFTVDGISATVTDTPKTWTGLTSATEAVTFAANSTETSSCTGTGVTGSDPNWVVNMSSGDVTDMACTVSGAAAVSFSDDFSGVDLSKWTIKSGTWNHDTTNNEVDFSTVGAGVLLYTDESTGSASQWFAVEFAKATSIAFDGLIFRSDNTTGRVYVLRGGPHDTKLMWRSCTSYTSCDEDIQEVLVSTLGTQITNDDSLGLEVSGTGDSTVVDVWIWADQGIPARGSWGTATTSFTNNPTNPANTGQYGGLYTGTNSTSEATDFQGGAL